MCSQDQGWQDWTLQDGTTITVQVAHVGALVPVVSEEGGTIVWIDGQQFHIKETVAEIWGNTT